MVWGFEHSHGRSKTCIHNPKKGRSTNNHYCEPCYLLVIGGHKVPSSWIDDYRTFSLSIQKIVRWHSVLKTHHGMPTDNLPKICGNFIRPFSECDRQNMHTRLTGDRKRLERIKKVPSKNYLWAHTFTMNASFHKARLLSWRLKTNSGLFLSGVPCITVKLVAEVICFPSRKLAKEASQKWFKPKTSDIPDAELVTQRVEFGRNDRTGKSQQHISQVLRRNRIPTRPNRMTRLSYHLSLPGIKSG